MPQPARQLAQSLGTPAKEPLARDSVRALAVRLAILAAMFGLEWLPLSAVISTGRGGQSAARALVAFLFFFFTFGYFRWKSSFDEICRGLAGKAPGWKFLAGHGAAMLGFIGISALPAADFRIPLLAAWYATGLGAVICGAFAIIPPAVWSTLVRRAGRLWVVAAVAAAAAWLLISPLWSAWDADRWTPGMRLTFTLTAKVLKPILPDLIWNSNLLEIGTPRFGIRIAGPCSGIEGAGLMLVFSIAWLWTSRAERRFPHALLLIPASAAVMWALNIVRLVVLILIGNAGAPGIAMGGFHSQAGWITFNLIAACVILFAGRIRWWTISAPRPAHEQAIENPSLWYLAPFLIILAASMVSRAGSASFEWLYPIRLLAGAAVLWHFRPKYRGLGWRCGWAAPVTGVAVFLIWVGFNSLHAHAASPPDALANAPVFAVIAWVACRTAAAVVIVPIAEELAFRGFLIRRLIDADFTSLDLQRFSVPAVLLSSGVFGALHGSRWIEGSLAGLLYAFSMLRRGKIGDAVVAHGTTNALIAAAVLLGGKWELW